MQHIKVYITELEGKALDYPAIAYLTMERLISDCSAWNIGRISMCGYNDEHNKLAIKLLVNKIVCDLHLCSNVSDKDWSNKYLFSSYGTAFTKDSPYCIFYKTMLGMSPHKKDAEHIITPPGWHGGPYEMRAIVIPKHCGHQNTLDIPWGTFKAHYEIKSNDYVQNKPIVGEAYTRCVSLKELLKKQSW